MSVESSASPLRRLVAAAPMAPVALALAGGLLGGQLQALAAAAVTGSSPANAQPPAAVAAAAPTPGVTTMVDSQSFTLPTTLRFVWDAPRFGRYSVWAESEVGVGIQPVDRSTGPGPILGEPGRQDGRLDAFLEAGPQLILGHAPDKGTGSVKLKARGFVELNEGAGSSPGQLNLLPPLLPQQSLQTSLADFEQRSWWVEVKAGQPVAVEAVGRYVSDIRLWREGEWMTADVPACRPVSIRAEKEGKSGRAELIDRRTCLLAASPPAGRYKLTVYGGVPMPQADGGDERGLFVRAGLETMPEAFRQRRVLSVAGVDRLVVPGTSAYARLELLAGKTAQLTARPYDPRQPFASPEQTQTISPESPTPVVDLTLPNRSAANLITVVGNPGTPYILQAFNPTSGMNLVASDTSEARQLYITTLQSGNPVDTLDATAIVFRSRNEPNPHPVVVASSAIPLSGTQGWSRRFNLTGTSELFVEVKEAGNYRFESPEGGVRVQVEPYFIGRAPSMAGQPMREAPLSLALNAGYYTVRLEPLKPGVTSLVMARDGRVDAVRAAWNVTDPLAKSMASSVFKALPIESGYNYILAQPQRAGVVRGSAVFRLPISDQAPELASRGLRAFSVPVYLPAGEMLKLPTKLSRRCRISLVSDSEGSLTLVREGGPAPMPTAPFELEAGEAVLRVSNGSGLPASASILVEPLLASELQAYVPPALPVVREGLPYQATLSRGGSVSVLVQVEEAGRYRIESTGRLAMAGQLRTRTADIQAPVASNGAGRNFLLDAWLPVGTYQVTASALGRSQGSVGIELNPTLLRQAGTLIPENPARTLQTAGEGLLYWLNIDKPGAYQISAFHVGRFARIGLADEEGWPLMVPGTGGNVSLSLQAGRYQLQVMPETVTARVQVLVQPVAESTPLIGHGPHALPLAELRALTWQEPLEGQFRQPDNWLFDLPAETELVAALTGEMEGSIFPANTPPTSATSAPSAQPLVWIPPREGWRGTLPAGSYRLEVRSYRPNNRQPYEVALWPLKLLEGLSRRVQVPASLPLQIGTQGMYSLRSFCGVDVQATLVDAVGQTIARADDMDDDWNFLLTQALMPASYTLNVTPVGADAGICEISLQALKFQTSSPRKLPLDEALILDNRVQATSAPNPSGEGPASGQASGQTSGQTSGAVSGALELSLDLGEGGASGRGNDGSSILWVRAEAAGVVGLQLAPGSGAVGSNETPTPAVEPVWLEGGSGRRPELMVPLTSSARFWRLRVWTQEAARTPVRLRVSRVTIPSQNLTAGGRELRLKALGNNSDWQGLAVTLPEPTALVLDGSIPAGLKVCETALAPCVPLLDQPGAMFRQPRLLPDGNNTLILLAPSTSSPAIPLVSRVLQPGSPLLVQTTRMEKAPASLKLQAGGLGPMLLLAHGSESPVGVRFGAAGRDWPPQAPSVWGQSVAVSLLLDARQLGLAQVWNAEAGAGPQSVALQVLPMHAIEKAALSGAETAPATTGKAAPDNGLSAPLQAELALTPLQPVQLTLPSGQKQLSLKLAPGVVAALVTGAQVDALIWADGEALNTLRTTASESLLLLPLPEALLPGLGVGSVRKLVDAVPVPGEAPRSLAASVRVMPMSSGSADAARGALPALTSDRPFVTRFKGAGVETIPVLPASPARPLRLSWVGPVSDVRLVEQQRLQRGAQSLRVEKGGLLTFRHGVGTVSFWLEPDDGSTQYAAEVLDSRRVLSQTTAATDPWRVEDGNPLTLSTFTTVSVPQAMRKLVLPPIPAGNALQVVASTELMLTLEPVWSQTSEAGADSRAAVRVRVRAGEPFVQVPAADGKRASWVLSLKALDLSTPLGEISLSLQPVQPLTEGPGPESLLAGGDARVFLLSVPQAGPLGLGVRAPRDGAQLRLLDSTGQPLGSGPLLMPTLQPGRYFLVLSLGAEETPLTARPVVVGLIQPSALPPAEIQTKFVAAGVGNQGAVARIVPPAPAKQAQLSPWSVAESVLSFEALDVTVPAPYAQPVTRLPMEGTASEEGEYDGERGELEGINGEESPDGTPEEETPSEDTPTPEGNE